MHITIGNLRCMENFKLKNLLANLVKSILSKMGIQRNFRPNEILTKINKVMFL